MLQRQIEFRKRLRGKFVQGGARHQAASSTPSTAGNANQGWSNPPFEYRRDRNYLLDTPKVHRFPARLYEEPVDMGHLEAHGQAMKRIALVAAVALAMCLVGAATAYPSLSIKKAGVWYWSGDRATSAIKPSSTPQQSALLHDGVIVDTVGCSGLMPSTYVVTAKITLHHRFRCVIQGQNSAGVSVHFGVTLVATGRKSATVTVR